MAVNLRSVRGLVGDPRSVAQTAQTLRQHLTQLDLERVPPALRLGVAELRERVLAQLVAEGQANPHALTAVQAEVARLREQQQKGASV